MELKKMKVGIIGCGQISKAYIEQSKQFAILDLVACADLNADAAKARAEEYNLRAMTPDALLADPDIELVVNLTVPKAHAAISEQTLKAGKHAYCEKPFGVSLEEARNVLSLAEKKKLRVGCAPDTVLGAGMQTCRKIIDDGWLGRIVGGAAFLMGRGPLGHPNPFFFFDKVGGGPMFDFGPYYITALVQLLGPVASVMGYAKTTFETLDATHETLRGRTIPVSAATHYAGALRFHGGPVVSMMMSFEVRKTKCPCIEIYGERGTLQVTNPNSFGGQVQLFLEGGDDWKEVPLAFPYANPSRSLGVADMAHAIRSGRPVRCDGRVATHVLEAMMAFEKSSEARAEVHIETSCERPAAMRRDRPLGFLD